MTAVRRRHFHQRPVPDRHRAAWPLFAMAYLCAVTSVDIPAHGQRVADTIPGAIIPLSRRKASADQHKKDGTPSMRRGGHYWGMRMSDYGPFPHVLYGRMGNDGKIWVISCKPVSPSPLFAKNVVRGDRRRNLTNRSSTGSKWCCQLRGRVWCYNRCPQDGGTGSRIADE